MSDLDPKYRIAVTTTISMQRLRAGSRELDKSFPGVFLGASADRLTWGLSRDWGYGQELRARWIENGHRELVSSLDQTFAHYSYRITSSEELRGIIERVRSRPEQDHWWYFDAGSDRYDALRTHLDVLEPALVRLGVLS